MLENVARNLKEAWRKLAGGHRAEQVPPVRPYIIRVCPRIPPHLISRVPESKPVITQEEWEERQRRLNISPVEDEDDWSQGTPLTVEQLDQLIQQEHERVQAAMQLDEAYRISVEQFYTELDAEMAKANGGP